MQVILLEKVKNLGNLGEIVNVRPGYGRNFLIPRGKAVTATGSNKDKYEARKLELETAAAALLADAQARAAKLNTLTVTVRSRAGEEGKLFGSVGTADIAHAASEAGVTVAKQDIRLSAGPLRQVGEYEVGVHLHPDVDAKLKVMVVAGG